MRRSREGYEEGRSPHPSIHPSIPPHSHRISLSKEVQRCHTGDRWVMPALSRPHPPVREIRESEIALGRDWGRRGLSPPLGTQRPSSSRRRRKKRR